MLLALPGHLGCDVDVGGCGGDDCLHDWECVGSSICIPYEERYQCVRAPVCESDDECGEDEPCIVRGKRIVDEGTRDPFTSDAPGKRTCGGFAGPEEREEESGCGSGGDPDDDGTGGSRRTPTTTATTTKSGSSSSTGGGAGGSGGSGGGGGGSGGAGGAATGGAGGGEGGAGGAGGMSGGGGA